MIGFKATALCVGMMVFSAGAAFAQSAGGSMGGDSGSMQNGSMQSGAMQGDSMSKDSMSSKHMSAADMKKMKSCKAMSHDMMMKNAGCMKMMKMHPDMMKHGG